MTNNSIFIDQMDKANSIAQSAGYVNAIAWAKKAYENKIISQYDYKKFENLHDLRNLVAHGSACDIQISDDTLNAVYAFCDAVANMDAVGSAQMGSILLKGGSLNQRRTYVKKDDYVLMYSENSRAYEIYRWGGDRFIPLAKYNTVTKKEATADGKFRYIYDLEAADYKYEISKEYPTYVIPTLPDEIAVCDKPYIRSARLMFDFESASYPEIYNLGRAFEDGIETVAYGYDGVLIRFDKNIFNPLLSSEGDMYLEGYLALPECFQAQQRLAFGDVKARLNAYWKIKEKLDAEKEKIEEKFRYQRNLPF